MSALFIAKSKIDAASRFVVFFLCLLGVAVTVADASGGEESDAITATVVNVDDGDTLIVSIDHRAVIVDLADDVGQVPSADAAQREQHRLGASNPAGIEAMNIEDTETETQ